MQIPQYLLRPFRPRAFLFLLWILWVNVIQAQPIYRPCRVSFTDKRGVLDCQTNDLRAWSCQIWQGEVLPSNLAQPDAVKKDGYWFIPWEELTCHSEPGLQPYFAGDFGVRGPSGILAVDGKGDTLFMHSNSASDWIFDSEPALGYPGLPLLIPFVKGCWAQESRMPTEQRLRDHHRYYRSLLNASDALPIPSYFDRVMVLEVVGKQFQPGEMVQISVKGTFYDGGNPQPYFTVQHLHGDVWTTVADYWNEELDDAMHTWLRREETMDLFRFANPDSEPQSQGLPVLEAEPGTYRVVMYDRYLAPALSTVFKVTAE